ncbi:hypothetical protein EHP00_1586 [Ecytonucleospora hepatopenaei]|uniref:Uncharacterized protein n=1 Tax=Ecytonucleospora hepatopenaei TaxID=646526 RepID=A0A1W0E7M6_9MICR|nr:hypothetical protein EHP00_1586 [Ecytonucleospora hepatopenaei]
MATEKDLLEARISILQNKNKQLENQNFKQLQKLSENELKIRNLEEEICKNQKNLKNFYEHKKTVGSTEIVQNTNILMILEQFVNEENIEGINFINDNFYFDIVNFDVLKTNTQNLDILVVFMDREKVFLKHIFDFVEALENTQTKSLLTGKMEYTGIFKKYFIEILNNISINVFMECVFGNLSNAKSKKLQNATTRIILESTAEVGRFLTKLSSHNSKNIVKILPFECFVKIQKENPKNVVVQNIIKNKNTAYVKPTNWHLFTLEQQIKYNS